MTNLNLLQISTKKQILSIIHYIQLVNGAIFLTLILMITSIILFASQSYLNLKINRLDEIANSSTENQNINRINGLITQVSTVQKDYVKWSQVLNNFFKLIPPNNRLSMVSFNKTENLLRISGHANDRNSFLKLKNNLENSDLVIEVDSPISNLLHQINFDFTLMAKLNL